MFFLSFLPESFTFLGGINKIFRKDLWMEGDDMKDIKAVYFIPLPVFLRDLLKRVVK